MSFKEIAKEIANVENQDIISEYKSFQYSIELLERNFHRLEKTIEEVKNNPKKFNLIPRFNKWLLEGIIKEIGFLVHNYVSSSMSLLEHSRRVYEKMFEKKDDLDNYEKLKKTYLTSPYLKFVQDLRRMLQHHSLTSIAYQYSGGTGKTTFYLQKIDLLRFKDWTSKSKKLIKSFEDRINVIEVIKIYHQEINNFHKEVNSKFRIIYKEELKKLDELNAQYNSKVNELGITELREHVENFEDQGFHGIKFSLSKWLNSSEQAELFKKAKSDKEYCKLALPIVKKKVSIPNDLEKLITKLIIEC